MIQALTVTCPHCGQETPCGVIAEKEALDQADKIRVRCEYCGKQSEIRIRDVHFPDTSA